MWPGLGFSGWGWGLGVGDWGVGCGVWGVGFGVWGWADRRRLGAARKGARGSPLLFWRSGVRRGLQGSEVGGKG